MCGLGRQCSIVCRPGKRSTSKTSCPCNLLRDSEALQAALLVDIAQFILKYSTSLSDNFRKRLHHHCFNFYAGKMKQISLLCSLFFVSWVGQSARGETPFAPKFETFLQLNVSPIYLVSKLMAVVEDTDLHFWGHRRRKQLWRKSKTFQILIW